MSAPAYGSSRLLVPPVRPLPAGSRTEPPVRPAGHPRTASVTRHRCDDTELVSDQTSKAEQLTDHPRELHVHLVQLTLTHLRHQIGPSGRVTNPRLHDDTGEPGAIVVLQNPDHVTHLSRDGLAGQQGERT